MSETTTPQPSPSTPAAEDAPTPGAMVSAASQANFAGVSAYQHGQRSVTRAAPAAQLDFAERVESRNARRRRGPFLRVSMGN